MCDFVVNTVLIKHPREQWWPGTDPVHWKDNVIISTKYSSLAALELVIVTISNAAGDDLSVLVYIHTHNTPIHTYTHMYTHFTGITSNITILVIIIIIIIINMNFIIIAIMTIIDFVVNCLPIYHRSVHWQFLHSM